MSASTCIAYREDGTLCRAPATILDHQRGGMVCLQHVPDDVAEEITLYLKMGTVEGRIDHDGEVYTWRLEEPASVGQDWTTRAVAVLQEVQSVIGAGLLTHPLPELVDDLRDRIAQLLREADALETYHCPTHGVCSRRRGEVRQAEVDKVCLYVCSACGQIADPTSFPGRTEDPRC
jgi:hypothetical protein